ncbi:extracellular solute-binding protein [Nonomuraea sp. NPDC046802]|uniref:extracellular solute-binding protein n=1 Tax=Nonomuraea sp. NPDC046802 TaxID=3154919 RepID=UPI0033C3FBE6
MVRSSRTSRRLLAAGLLAGLCALSGCGNDTGGTGSNTGKAVDDGSTITMWARASTASQSQALVKAYNATHKNQISLTVVPTDNYLQKVGIAAGARDLPCLLAADVAYTPDFTSKKLYQDITKRVDALPFAAELTPSHMTLGTRDGQKYTVPHTIGMSAIFQNDVLLKAAGIDPSAELTSLKQLADNARKVAALGNGEIGLYYTGNNGGSIAFTHFPSIWASGGEALSEDGTTSRLAEQQSVAVFQAYNQMFKDGSVSPSVRNESGATRDEVFATGKVGYMLASNSVVDKVPASSTLKIGVQGIPGVTSGSSTFVGGDAIGISTSCKAPDAAWDFLAWSLGDHAQVEVYAKSRQLTLRGDLAENKYAADDPRILKLNKLVGQGRTPYAVKFGQTFNDLNGPWLAVARGALFGADPAGSLSAATGELNESLSTR